MTDNIKRIRPQEGFQMQFLSSPADIVIGGSAAGVGKTFALLMEPLRHKDVEGFGAVFFRRTSPQIKAEGALWDTSMSMYPAIGGEPKESSLEWHIDKMKVKFSHLEYEKNILDWQGSQIPFIAFDELTHFTKRMFFYMLSRNRSTCGVKPYVRATCNPDPESWVFEFIEWWIDEETGFVIPEREGVLRYFMVNGDSYVWGDSKKEVIEKAWHILEPMVEKSGIDPEELIKSVTFIAGSIYDNKELLSVNPSYLGNLLAQGEAEQQALLHGNWKVILSDNDIYDYHAFVGLFNNVFELESKERYITADIALKGADKFVVGVWYGLVLEDILIMDKSNGKEVVDGIKLMAKTHKVQNRHILFDNDGLGAFVDGFIVGAVEFHNGGRPLPHPTKPSKDAKGKVLPENYDMLKTQCYYKSGELVSSGEILISENVANKMYDNKMTVKQRFMFERKAIKRDKVDSDGKLKINSKADQKLSLQGQSPDLMDMFMMRAYFEYFRKPKSNSKLLGNLAR